MPVLQHRIERLASGTVVHVWAPAGTVTGLVQLQHGFAEHAERYVHEHGALVPALLDLGHEVWAMDLQGHGRSPGRPAVTDAREAVREHGVVRRRMRARRLPIVVVGHSFGGLVSAASVVRDPIGVRRLLLTAPVVLGRTPLPLRLAARALAAVAPASHVPGRAATMTHDPAVARRAAADPLMYQGTTTLRVGATALDVADGLWRRLDRWAVPTTVFHGTQDEAAAYSRSVALVRSIGRSDVVLRTVDGGRHELLHDVAAGRSTLHALLAEISAGE